MVVARTVNGWEPWVCALTAKQRNFLVKEMKLPREEIDSLKVECRKWRQRKAQSEYVSDYCFFFVCAVTAALRLCSQFLTGAYRTVPPTPFSHVPSPGSDVVQPTPN